MSLIDTLDRPLRSLRLSVTDRCNIRCQYCMPEQEYAWLPRESILAFEEVGRLVDVFTGVGVDRLRITGGEPLLRRDLPSRSASTPCGPNASASSPATISSAPCSRASTQPLRRASRRSRSMPS
jgi:hypothetical protein